LLFLGNNPFHGNTFLAEILAGGFALAFWTVVTTAAFTFGERGSGFFADLTDFFLLGHE
jgi:hypothetical protein